jgi:nucleotide-binding universal stress UspA family protein
MFTHILVPIDGSAHSLKAAGVAIDLALKYGSRLTFLHVTRRFPVPEKLKEYLSAEQLQGEQLYALDEATEKVMADVKAEAEAKGIAGVKMRVKEGKPSRTIVEYAANHAVDAIVMGSRGLTDIEAALLGSVSHKVSSLAACTVVVTR